MHKLIRGKVEVLRGAQRSRGPRNNDEHVVYADAALMVMIVLEGNSRVEYWSGWKETAGITEPTRKITCMRNNFLKFGIFKNSYSL